jgi:hypothetical protein
MFALSDGLIELLLNLLIDVDRLLVFRLLLR